jgi:hypothetical protein
MSHFKKVVLRIKGERLKKVLLPKGVRISNVLCSTERIMLVGRRGGKR